MFTIVVVGDAAPPWVPLLEVWRRLAAVTFPRHQTLACALESPASLSLSSSFVAFSEWARGKGLCRYVFFNFVSLMF
jgi:hypothetical protein